MESLDKHSYRCRPKGAAMSGPAIARRAVLVIACAVLAAVSVGVLAGAKMRSAKLSFRLCQTTGGGKFARIPGFPGERIDRRLLTDIRWLERRYRIFITDGYSRSDVHAKNGEHPIGLALDIVPNKERGGTWNDVDRLADWAEPTQNHPRAPFRWVGYDGDASHGRGNHLHLSWSHSATDPGDPARIVYTIRCPRQPDPPETPPPPTSTGGTTGDGETTSGGSVGGSDPSGGIGKKVAPKVVETDGVSLDDRR